MKICCQRLFKDLDDAYEKLMDAMPVKKMRRFPTLVVAISLEAEHIAKKMARMTNSEYALMLTVPIQAPNNEALTIARVSETQDIVMNKQLMKAFDIKEDFVYNQAIREHEEKLMQQSYKYRQGEQISRFDNRYVILVDNGVETGLTAMTAIKTAIELGGKNVYMATPVIAEDVKRDLLSVADEVFTPYAVEDFIDTEFYYESMTIDKDDER